MNKNFLMLAGVWVIAVFVAVIYMFAINQKGETIDNSMEISKVLPSEAHVPTQGEEGEMTDEVISDDTSAIIDDPEIQAALGGFNTENISDFAQDPSTSVEIETVPENGVVDPVEAQLVSGVYAPYTKELVGQSDITVLFFHAAWCPSCQSLDNVLTTAAIPEWFSILKTDYDTEIDLRKKYDITSQHTFVQIGANWETVTKWVWWNTLDDIISKVGM